MTHRPPLRVWVLSDGRAGHYNQARGVVRALARSRDPAVDWIDMQLRAGFLRSLLRGLVNRHAGRLPLALLHLFYRFRLPPGRPQLIVSAGGKTSFANAWLAQALDVPNFYAGSLRRIRPECFTAVLTLEATGDSDRFLVLDLPPGPVEPAAPGATADGAPRCWALLLGGDGAGYRYTAADWRALAQVLQALAREQDLQWLVVGSRRTAGVARELLEQNLDARYIKALYWYGRDEDFDMDAVLGAAQRVLVTEDSMTMLSEAIQAQKPVHSLRPRQAVPAERYQRALQRYVARGWLCRHTLADLAQDPQQIPRQTCHPLQRSPLIDLGARLEKYLSPHVQ